VSDVAERPESVSLTAKGQRTRARIVAVAADVVHRHGAATSIEDIRKAAGVSGSQLTHYFDGKRELLREVVAARTDEVFTFHTQPSLGALDSFDALQQWVDLNVDKQIELQCVGGCTYGALAGGLAEADEETRRDLACGYEQWLELFRSGLAAMRDRGELRPDADPTHLAIMLLSAHQGGSLMTQITRRIEPLREALTAALNYVKSFRTVPSRRRPTR
jgi:TetR/AcrR family transcriptional regulator, transcriptional repressor for nem operon